MKVVSALSALALAQAQQLEKPALSSNLDYLLEGNTANLPSIASQISIWEAGHIPKDCKDLGEGESLSAADFEVYNVQYDDVRLPYALFYSIANNRQCSDPWIICRHKDAEPVIADVAETFGKLPVKVRDWVRQVLVIPGGNSAFAINGNVAFIGTTGTNVDVVIHEAAHGLDGFAAFGENLSSTSTPP
jgi:hypothetical protein